MPYNKPHTCTLIHAVYLNLGGNEKAGDPNQLKSLLLNVILCVHETVVDTDSKVESLSMLFVLFTDLEREREKEREIIIKQCNFTISCRMGGADMLAICREVTSAQCVVLPQRPQGREIPNTAKSISVVQTPLYYQLRVRLKNTLQHTHLQHPVQ